VDTAIVELDYRQGGGFEVALLWHRDIEAVSLTIRDSRSGQSLEVPVAHDQAMQAFNHPFAYAASISAHYAVKDVFTESRPHWVTTTAAHLWSGRRVLLRGADHNLAEMVAAYSAAPFLFAPVRVEGRLLVDGCVRSLVHADQAAPAQHLLVLAPLAGNVCGPAGRVAETITSREMRQWQATNQSETHLIRISAGVSAARGAGRLAPPPGQTIEAGSVRPAIRPATMTVVNRLTGSTRFRGLLLRELRPFEVDARPRYDGRDPSAVALVVSTSLLASVVWTFARELLAAGLMRPI
jgi:hypothetical protein